MYSQFGLYHTIRLLLLTSTLHAVFVVVVDYGLEHYVALDGGTSGCSSARIVKKEDTGGAWGFSIVQILNYLRILVGRIVSISGF